MTAQAFQRSASAAHPIASSRAEVEARLAGAAMVALGAAFLMVTMLAASLAPGYDFNAAAISDLGVIPQTALLFNGLLIVIGALNVAAGVLLHRAQGGAWLLGVYALAGLGAIGAGLMPLDRGDLHSLFALVGFVFFNIEAVITGGRIRGALRWAGIVAGLVGLAYVVIMVIGDAGNPAIFGAIGHGGAERMIVYPAMLWLVAAGGALLAGGPEDRQA